MVEILHTDSHATRMKEIEMLADSMQEKKNEEAVEDEETEEQDFTAV